MKTSKKISITIAATLVLAGVSACSSYDDERGKGDAAVTDGFGHRKGNDNPKMVTNFPNDFANISTSCVAPGFRAFVTTATHADGFFLVMPDPKCNKYTDVEQIYKG